MGNLNSIIVKNRHKHPNMTIIVIYIINLDDLKKYGGFMEGKLTKALQRN